LINRELRQAIFGRETGKLEAEKAKPYKQLMTKKWTRVLGFLALAMLSLPILAVLLPVLSVFLLGLLTLVIPLLLVVVPVLLVTVLCLLLRPKAAEAGTPSLRASVHHA
jgi:hypothetical protein